jgi:hypothetical protein
MVYKPWEIEGGEANYTLCVCTASRDEKGITIIEDYRSISALSECGNIANADAVVQVQHLG